jgi:hypothetical protein
MVAKKGNGIFIIVVSTIIIIGGGITYLLYRKSKKGETKEEPSEDGITSDEVVNSSSEIPSNDNSSSSSSSSSNEITDNPFKTKEDLKKFQRWILKYHETDGTYGKGSATPVKKDDGIWGEKSATAWDKYGKRYIEVTKAVVNKPKDSKSTPFNESLKLKLGSDGSNVSAVKQIINQLALWEKYKTLNGVNFPIDTSTKFDTKLDKVLDGFFWKYKSQGYITRGQARELWAFTAGEYDKTFPSALVGSSNEKLYRENYKKGKDYAKEKSKKKFSSFGQFVETKDNFS